MPHTRISEEQEIEIGEAFDLMDFNKIEQINTKDFKLAMKALGIELPRYQYIQLISNIDKTYDGQIGKKVFIKEMRKLLSIKDPKENIVKAFHLMDEYDTGKISFQDLKNVAKILGEKVTDQQIYEMLNVADEDGDGQVNLTEFLKLMDRASSIMI